MATYRFQIRKYIRDDMYKQEFVDIELTDKEYQSITSDDGNYSKTSSLASSKIGENVKVLGFPSKVNSNLSTKEKSKTNGKSFWKPFWAIPFKLVWLVIKMILPFK
jgi:hypothetical protein